MIEVRSDNPVVAVSRLNRMAREALEVALPALWINGEVSNLVRAASGHVYFTLKDERAQVRCTLWRSRAQLLPFRLEQGQEVEVRAQATLYEARGDFQLNVDAVRRAGVGNLYEAFLRLRAELEREGLFDPAAKRPLPRFPRAIGVITSPQAAALRDVLAALARRAPGIPVILYPAPVQGEGAPGKLVEALRQASMRHAEDRVDVLLLVRGGGSIEDLWAFNDERVARAIFAAQHPIISGVGHETDFTITDFVADLRAPTPSAAAELAVPDREELYPLVLGLQNGLTADMKSRIQEARWEVQSLGQQLVLHNPRRGLDGSRQRIDMLVNRLDQSMERRLTTARNRLALLEARLTAVNPHTILARGYAIVRDPNGRLLRTAANATVGQHLHVQLSDGVIEVEVISNR